MKKYLLSAILLIAIILPAGSVLNEKNLAKTLSVLRLELENTFNKQQRMISRLKVMSEVPSEFDGVVKEICVQNGDAVEFDQTIMVLE